MSTIAQALLLKRPVLLTDTWKFLISQPLHSLRFARKTPTAVVMETLAALITGLAGSARSATAMETASLIQNVMDLLARVNAHRAVTGR